MKFLKNILLAIVISALGLFLLDLGINWYTSHGDTIVVPDVTKLTHREAEAKLKAAGLKPIIQDSVYTEDVPRLAISDQDPVSKRKVKKGRKVYLTINSMSKPKVRMPKLVDKSFNLGKALLKNTGLELGNTTEKYSLLGSGVIVQQYFNGDSIVSGKLIEKGSKIDLLVSKYIDIDSVYIQGIDTSLIEGWQYKEGFMNEKARRSLDKQIKNAQDSAKTIENKNN